MQYSYILSDDIFVGQTPRSKTTRSKDIPTLNSTPKSLLVKNFSSILSLVRRKKKFSYSLWEYPFFIVSLLLDVIFLNIKKIKINIELICNSINYQLLNEKAHMYFRIDFNFSFLFYRIQARIHTYFIEYRQESFNVFNCGYITDLFSTLTM